MKRVASYAGKHIVEGLFPTRLMGLRRGARAGKVAITFDDGPHPRHTEEILKVLREEQVKASFFLVGQEMEKFPGLVRQIALEGHDVGNHGFSHGRMERLGVEGLREEIERTEELIQELAGSSKRLFRPPYGRVTLALMQCALRDRLTVVLWSLDSGDSHKRPPQELSDRLRSAESGDIILLHEDYAQTAAGIRDVIRALKSRGLGFARVSEWVGRR